MNETSGTIPVRILGVLIVVAMVGCALVALWAVVAIVADLASSADMFDGLGVFLGLLGLGGALVIAVMLRSLQVLLVRRPRAGLWVTFALGCLGLGGTALFIGTQVVGNTSSAPWDLALGYGLAGLLVVGLAGWGLLSGHAGHDRGSGAP